MKARRSERDDEWLACALSDTIALLKDHAHCEKKAAASAVGMISRYWNEPRLVSAMAELAAEEMGHFAEVHDKLVARGQTLGPDLGDPYAQALIERVSARTQRALDAPHWGETKVERMVDRLLVGALIEARSCERLRLLGVHHPEAELAEMFMRFARSEANHGNLFVKLARELGPGRAAVDARLETLSDFESAWVDQAPIRCAIH